MFKKGQILAIPTDTSFGLAVRADDEETMDRMNTLKGRGSEKFFSLVVGNAEMLRKFAKLPDNFDAENWFFEKPRTAILEPTKLLPKSKFWPENKVAFRISTIPDIADEILKSGIPVTATSANISGKPSLFNITDLQEVFGDNIRIYDKIPKLPFKEPSEIWDFTENPTKKIR